MHLYVDNPDGKVQLQFPLEGEWSIALKEICYVVGYHNICQERGNNTFQYERADGTSRSAVPDGLYSLGLYEKELRKVAGSGLSISARPFDGKAVVSVTHDSPLKAFTVAAGVLGFSTELRIPAGYEMVSMKPIDLLSPKQLFVHCPQIKGDTNLYNGKPSDILEVLPVSPAKFGHVETQRITNPSFKTLAPRSLHEIFLQIKDEEGSVVNFHDSYIRYSLVLHQNEHIRS